MSAEIKPVRIHRAGLTDILRFEVGGAFALGGGEGELHLREGDPSTDRKIGYNTKGCNCICIDGEGRSEREYPGEIESRKADLEDLDGWTRQGALNFGGDIEDGRSVSGNTTSESLSRLRSGTGGISWEGSTYQVINMRGDNCTGHNKSNICGHVDIDMCVDIQTPFKPGNLA